MFCCSSLHIYTHTQFCSPHKASVYLTQLEIGFRGTPRQIVCEGWPLNQLGMRTGLELRQIRYCAHCPLGIVFSVRLIHSHCVCTSNYSQERLDWGSLFLGQFPFPLRTVDLNSGPLMWGQLWWKVLGLRGVPTLSRFSSLD